MQIDDPLAELVTRQRREVGDRLRRLRIAAGLTQMALADRAGLDHRTISRCENGHRAISIDVVARLAYGLDLPSWRLFRDDAPPDTGQRSM